MQAFADVVRQGKALYIGVTEWTADQIRAGVELSQRARLPADLQPAAVLHALARHRGRGRPDLRGARRLPDRVAARWRRACSPASTSPASRCPRARAPRTSKGGADMISRFMTRRRAHRGAGPQADRRRLRADHGAARRRVGAAERQRRRRPRRRLAARAGRRQRQGRRREARRRRDDAHRRGPGSVVVSATRARPRRACRRPAQSDVRRPPPAVSRWPRALVRPPRGGPGGCARASHPRRRRRAGSGPATSAATRRSRRAGAWRRG